MYQSEPNATGERWHHATLTSLGPPRVDVWLRRTRDVLLILVCVAFLAGVSAFVLASGPVRQPPIVPAPTPTIPDGGIGKCYPEPSC